MKYKKINAPFGWVGGKSKLAKDIVALMPSYLIYIEVFAGALHVLYAKPKTKFEVINDINSELINLQSSTILLSAFAKFWEHGRTICYGN